MPDVTHKNLNPNPEYQKNDALNDFNNDDSEQLNNYYNNNPNNNPPQPDNYYNNPPQSQPNPNYDKKPAKQPTVKQIVTQQSIQNQYKIYNNLLENKPNNEIKPNLFGLVKKTTLKSKTTEQLKKYLSQLSEIIEENLNNKINYPLDVTLDNITHGPMHKVIADCDVFTQGSLFKIKTKVITHSQLETLNFDDLDKNPENHKKEKNNEENEELAFVGLSNPSLTQLLKCCFYNNPNQKYHTPYDEPFSNNHGMTQKITKGIINSFINQISSAFNDSLMPLGCFNKLNKNISLHNAAAKMQGNYQKSENTTPQKNTLISCSFTIDFNPHNNQPAQNNNTVNETITNNANYNIIIIFQANSKYCPFKTLTNQTIDDPTTAANQKINQPKSKFEESKLRKIDNLNIELPVWSHLQTITLDEIKNIQPNDIIIVKQQNKIIVGDNILEAIDNQTSLKITKLHESIQTLHNQTKANRSKPDNQMDNQKSIPASPQHKQSKQSKVSNTKQSPSKIVSANNQRNFYLNKPK